MNLFVSILFLFVVGLVISNEKHLLDIQTLTKQIVSVKEPINYNSTAVQNISNNLSCYRCFSFQKWCADEEFLKMIGKAAIMEDCAQCFYIFGKHDEKPVHIRGCAKHIEFKDGCFETIDKQDTELYTCYCSNDLCNGSPGNLTSSKAQRIGANTIYGVIVVFVLFRFK